MSIELIVIGIIIGATSGFFGVGGGMILVPLLVIIGFDIKSAIGISIIQMVFSSIYGSYLNFKKGTLNLGDGLYVGIGGFVGGFIGGYVTQYVSSASLEYLFVGLMIFALYKLFKSTKIADDAPTKSLHWSLLFVVGMAISSFTISLGVGGSILLTPILAGILHYPIKKAVSAGLFFVLFSSVAGLIGRFLSDHLDIINGLNVGLASLVGVFIGIWLKDHVTSHKHKLLII
ncbi:MAG: sulfite exporter TauE/SafE family protein, partial [Campylobacterales bacterium]|nr:sulfite exporter TauE/SafE family protein [Campylobacterales bacterium]